MELGMEIEPTCRVGISHDYPCFVSTPVLIRPPVDLNSISSEDISRITPSFFLLGMSNFQLKSN
jgi:hypothetical protein